MIDGTARGLKRRAVLGLLGAALLPGGNAGAAGHLGDGDTAAVVTANGEFGFDLYARLRAGSGNLFYSPYSISDALAMTYAGARGATADEMARALRFSLPPARLHPAFGRLIREINGAERKRQYELSTANALWSQKGSAFVPDFQRIAQGSYGAALAEVDFKHAPETARQTINTWVEKQTQDKIKDLIREGMLKADTLLVLTNAIYFKGAWVNDFPEAATKPADFLGGPKGAVRTVQLMQQRNIYRYLDGDTFQVLDLPYQANEVSLIVCLPRRVDGLGDVEKTLSLAGVNDWLTRMTQHDVDVALPRFKLTAELELERLLPTLGMKLAFTRRADFSAMIKSQPVYVDAVIHKAYVDVNEKGTEAAAATGVTMKMTSAAPPRWPGAVFRADHPFAFFIRDNRTGSILFAGRLTDPPAS